MDSQGIQPGALNMNDVDHKLALISDILNQPAITWKIRRALLVQEAVCSYYEAEQLVPHPSEGMDFHPSDY